MNRKMLGQLMVIGAIGFSFVLSVYLWFSGEREQGMFVGLWVPSLIATATLLLVNERTKK